MVKLMWNSDNLFTVSLLSLLCVTSMLFIVISIVVYQRLYDWLMNDDKNEHIRKDVGDRVFVSPVYVALFAFVWFVFTWVLLTVKTRVHRRAKLVFVRKT